MIGDMQVHDSAVRFTERLNSICLSAHWAARGAFGAERSGSTFTPGTLGDYNLAVVSTNPGLYLRNDMFYYEGTAARTVRNGEINFYLDQATRVESAKLTLGPGVTLLGKWIHEFYTRDRFAGDYIYFCFATRL